MDAAVQKRLYQAIDASNQILEIDFDVSISL
jgi:hypothetical protein